MDRFYVSSQPHELIDKYKVHFTAQRILQKPVSSDEDNVLNTLIYILRFLLEVQWII